MDAAERWNWRSIPWPGFSKPRVGCVLVKDGVVVGVGRHEYDKRDHAEIVCVEDVPAKPPAAQRRT